MRPFDLDEYLTNPSRRVVTKDGRTVKIHCTNFIGLFPIVAEIEGIDLSMTFNKNGKYISDATSSYGFFFAEEE